MSPGSFPPLPVYRDGGPHRPAAGEWTDDTSMALALADSIATVGWDLNDKADEHVQMVENRQVFGGRASFDIGVITRDCAGQVTSPRKIRFDSGDPLRTCQRQWLDHATGTRSDPLRPIAIPTSKRLDNFQDWPRSPVGRRMPANSACRRAGIWRPVLAALVQGADWSRFFLRLEPLQFLIEIKPCIR